MVFRNNSRFHKIPLNNDDREIMKLAIFNCCKKWKRAVYMDQINDKQRCHTCSRWVMPIIKEWSKRWFGSFKCTARDCGRTWTSSWSWTVDNQIQPTQCQDCRTSVLPYQLVSQVQLFVNYNSYESLPKDNPLDYLTCFSGRTQEKRFGRRRFWSRGTGFEQTSSPRSMFKMQTVG